jgi:AraC family transcriptional regulator of adaptative response/methylated-DNA-[protein]-cysteine methyltransferase
MIPMNAIPSIREMQRAYRERDTSYDGIFFVAVRSTGIFCRPSCPAKSALPGNLRYFLTAQDAAEAGYRPCKRCRPTAGAAPPVWVERVMDRVAGREARITDSELLALGVDPSRIRRYFQKHYGMTFRAYCRALRMGQALDGLRRGKQLDDVALGNGYESHSGFRDAFSRTFGRPPGAGRGTDCIMVSRIESPIGPLVIAAGNDGVCLVEFDDPPRIDTQLNRLKSLFSCAIVPGSNAHLDQLRDELESYFAGRLRRFSVPLVYPGTPFQVRVWSGLLTIPYGETRSYEDLARAAGSPNGQRAVGLANGSNRIAIVIPCHRVVNKSGKLGGYGGGLWRKQRLLDLEQSR